MNSARTGISSQPRRPKGSDRISLPTQPWLLDGDHWRPETQFLEHPSYRPLMVIGEGLVADLDGRHRASRQIRVPMTFQVLQPVPQSRDPLRVVPGRWRVPAAAVRPPDVALHRPIPGDCLANLVLPDQPDVTDRREDVVQARVAPVTPRSPQPPKQIVSLEPVTFHREDAIVGGTDRGYLRQEPVNVAPPRRHHRPGGWRPGITLMKPVLELQVADLLEAMQPVGTEVLLRPACDPGS